MADDQLAKKAVNYRKGDEDMDCAGCKHFVQPSSCEVVQGLISPSALCDMFDAQDDEGEQEPQGMDGLMSELFGPKGTAEDEEEQEEEK